MKIIGLCNLKGGVGKTTACQNIAAAFAKSGRRTAVIDMDPQSNLSAGFGLTLSPEDPQLFDILTGAANWDDIVRTKEDVDIIPSSLSLVMAELNQEGPLKHNGILREALSKVDPDRYDYIFLDSPPQLGPFTRNVLTACSKIIVPMDGGFFSLIGLRLLAASMPVLRERLNPELELAGIIMTNYNPRLYIARQVYEDVRKNYGDVLFTSCIRQNVSIIEASSMGMSVFAYSPKSKGAQCYREAADELIERLEGGRAGHEETGIEQAHDVPDEIVPETTDEIRQKILEMAPEEGKAMWVSMLNLAGEITRRPVDPEALRSDFEASDKDRYTFYICPDSEGTLSPVMSTEQFSGPLYSVLKWDENGAVEFYM